LDNYTIPTLRKENTRLIKLTAEIDALFAEARELAARGQQLAAGLRAIVERK